MFNKGLPPVPSFLSSLCIQKIQNLSPQENFTDYLLSWLLPPGGSPNHSLFNPSERNYDVGDQELLAIKLALEE
ncbi:hypothetical protein AMECASPLE_026835 [Ameca splendens]|uniref:Uncharacterized protein n=1 Tax=Ameca splendens TaxID=208324 RepID=A0ABV0XHZ7_9TELE